MLDVADLDLVLPGLSTEARAAEDALNLACDLVRGLLADILGAGWVGIVEAFIAAVTGEAPIECF